MNEGKLLKEISEKEISILGTNLCCCGIEEGVDIIDKAIGMKRKYRAMIVNAACINISFSNRQYRDIVAGYHVRFVDGIGVYLAGRILHRIKIPDLGGNPFGRSILKKCAEKGYRVFLLGAKPEVVEKAAENFVKWHDDLQIAGWHHGYFKPEENEKVINTINTIRPDLLIVCFGKPREVFWIADNFDKLDIGLAIPMGGFFDFQSGYTPRAPEWILRIRFEWFYRLLNNPARFWKRYIIGNFIFMARVFRWKFLGH